MSTFSDMFNNINPSKFAALYLCQIAAALEDEDFWDDLIEAIDKQNEKLEEWFENLKSGYFDEKWHTNICSDEKKVNEYIEMGKAIQKFLEELKELTQKYDDLLEELAEEVIKANT